MALSLVFDERRGRGRDRGVIDAIVGEGCRVTVRLPLSLTMSPRPDGLSKVAAG